MHHNVRTFERRPQRVDVANVTGAIVHLRPAALGRVEGPPRDADDGSISLSSWSKGISASPKVPDGPVTATVSPVSFAIRTP